MDLSPDGRWLAAGVWQARGVAIWDARTGEITQKLEAPYSAICRFSPDGLRLAIGDTSGYRILRASTWRTERTVPHERIGDHSFHMAFAPGGDRLLVLSSTASVRLVSTAGGAEVATFACPRGYRPNHPAYAPSGNFLALGIPGGSLWIWDLPAADRVLRAAGLEPILPGRE